MSKMVFPLVIILLLLTGGYFAISGLVNSGNGTKAPTSLSTIADPKILLTKVQELNRIETVSQNLQRSFDLNLDYGDLKIFSLKIENKKDLKFQVSGSVIAGIDTTKIQPQDLVIKGQELSIKLPAPEILSVEIDADKLAILASNSTALFKLQNLTDEKNRQTDELVKKSAIKQAQNYLADGACQSDIYKAASANANKVITELYTKAGYNVTIKNSPAPLCANLSTSQDVQEPGKTRDIIQEIKTNISQIKQDFPL